MKKVFALLLAVALLLSLAACGGKNTADQPENGNTVNEPADNSENGTSNGDEASNEQGDEPGNEPEDTGAPDLNQYCEDFLASLGEENAPAMMDVEGELIEIAYPEILSYAHNQLVLKIAAISSVPYEFALIELKEDKDVQAVEEMFQARIDSQVSGGAYYPETIAGWEKAQVVTHGKVVALICANEEQDAAVRAFNLLFE